MTSAQIFSEARARGIELRATGDRLLFRSAQTVQPKLRAALRANKTELLEILRQQEDAHQKGMPGVDAAKLREVEEGFTCLDTAPFSVVLCIADPDQNGCWLAYRRSDRRQQGRGDSQAEAVLALARAEGDGVAN
jgi:hypothetical protein